MMKKHKALMLLIGLGILSGLVNGTERPVEYEMVVQRASEAAIWAMPAVSVYDIELSIQRDLGGKPGDVAYFTKPMTSRHGFLTANDVTPYVTSGLSCKDVIHCSVPPGSCFKNLSKLSLKRKVADCRAAICRTLEYRLS